MPRFGSVCEDKVWRVPKLTSFSTVGAEPVLADLVGDLARGRGGGGHGRGEGAARSESELFHGCGP